LREKYFLSGSFSSRNSKRAFAGIAEIGSAIDEGELPSVITGIAERAPQMPFPFCGKGIPSCNYRRSRTIHPRFYCGKNEPKIKMNCGVPTNQRLTKPGFQAKRDS
jgi:hypothetical protein